MKNQDVDIKIQIPIANKDSIERRNIEIPIHRRLIRVTIVKAPAGYGKTTLVAKAFSETEDHVAWLTLDEMDNDPVRFWTYVIKAVAKSGKPINTEFLLDFVKTSPPNFFIVDKILNELGNKSMRTYLILDQYHLITNPAIHGMMNRLVQHLPHHIKVFILSENAIPLSVAKWRGNGWTHEIGIDELQFQPDEVKRFFETRFHHSPYPLSHYERAGRIAQGWPLGLQLIYLAGLQDERQWDDDESSILSPVITNYLLHEVINNVSSALKKFLMQTSLLKELSPSICNTLLDRNDSEALLNELEEKGLFVQRLQNDKQIYGYHPIFSNALQNEMKQHFNKAHITELYLKTANLFYGKGDYSSAIELAIENKMFDLADRWIAENILTIFLSRQMELLKRWILNLRKNNVEVNPETLAVYGFILALQFETEKSISIVRELGRRDNKNPWTKNDVFEDATYILEILKSFLLFTQPEVLKSSIPYLTEQDSILISAQSAKWNSVLLDYNHYEPQLLRTVLTNKGKIGSFKQLAAFNQVIDDDMLYANNLARYRHGLQAEIYYEQNLLAESQLHINKLMKSSNPHFETGLMIPMYIVQAKIYMAENQYVKGQAFLKEAIGKTVDPIWKSTLLTMKALGYIREGLFERAEVELNKSSSLLPRRSKSMPEFWLLVQARLFMERNDIRKALHSIDQVIQASSENSQMLTLIEAKILRSICIWKTSKKNLALHELHGTLELAAKYGYKRMFLEEADLHHMLNNYIKNRINTNRSDWNTVSLKFVKSLVGNYTVQPVESRESTRPKLTPREEQLIKALITGSSNKEIAEELFLSEGTVRVYLSKVYKKLNVKSRTQAILQFKEWQ